MHLLNPRSEANRTRALAFAANGALAFGVNGTVHGQIVELLDVFGINRVPAAVVVTSALPQVVPGDPVGPRDPAALQVLREPASGTLAVGAHNLGYMDIIHLRDHKPFVTQNPRSSRIGKTRLRCYKV